MKINFTILWIFLLNISITAQTWEKVFPSSDVIGSPGHTLGLEVILLMDGGYILAGGVSYPTGAPRDYIRLVKTDANGNSLWEHTYKEGDVAFDQVAFLHELPTSEILLAGFQGHLPYLIKTNSGGEIIWEKTIQTDTAHTVQSGINYDDNHILLMGYTSPGFGGAVETFVMKLNIEGDFIWKRIISLDITGFPSQIDKTSDGGFVIIGTSNFEIALSKFDSNGDSEWNHSYQISDDDLGNAVRETSDNGFILGGSIHGVDNNHFPVLLKTDSLGGAEWVKIISDSLSGGVTTIDLGDDGSYLAAGTIKDFWNAPQNGFVFKMAKTSTVEWSENLNAQNQQIASIRNTPDGGFILGGKAEGGMLLKKIGEIANNDNNIFTNVKTKVFPNPSSNQTTFLFENENQKTIYLQIFNSTGALVFEKTIRDNSFVFDAKNISNGIYFYQVKDENKMIANGKLIIQK